MAVSADQKRTFLDDFKDKHATALGNIAIAWNSLHELLGVTFTMLMDPASYVHSWAVWHSMRSDTQQRTTLGAVLDSALKGPPNPVLPEYEWLLGRIKPGERNASLHSPYGVIVENRALKFIAIDTSGHPLARKLQEKKDLLAEFIAYEARILAAVEFVRHLNKLLANNKIAPLPTRPDLLLNEQETTRGPKPPRNTKKARRRQQQASRAKAAR